jgi:hypothetical protein
MSQYRLLPTPRSGRGLLVRRLVDKAPGKVQKISSADTSLTARGGDGVTRPVNREPHLVLPSA